MLVNNDQQFIVEWKNNPCQQYVYNSNQFIQPYSMPVNQSFIPVVYYVPVNMGDLNQFQNPVQNGYQGGNYFCPQQQYTFGSNLQKDYVSRNEIESQVQVSRNLVQQNNIYPGFFQNQPKMGIFKQREEYQGGVLNQEQMVQKHSQNLIQLETQLNDSKPEKILYQQPSFEQKLINPLERKEFFKTEASPTIQDLNENKNYSYRESQPTIQNFQEQGEILVQKIQAKKKNQLKITSKKIKKTDKPKFCFRQILLKLTNKLMKFIISIEDPIIFSKFQINNKIKIKDHKKFMLEIKIFLEQYKNQINKQQKLDLIWSNPKLDIEKSKFIRSISRHFLQQIELKNIMTNYDKKKMSYYLHVRGFLIQFLSSSIQPLQNQNTN